MKFYRGTLAVNPKPYTLNPNMLKVAGGSVTWGDFPIYTFSGPELRIADLRARDNVAPVHWIA